MVRGAGQRAGCRAEDVPLGNPADGAMVRVPMAEGTDPRTGPGFETGRLFARVQAELFGEDPPELTLGRYRVIDVLGSGGMGVVYRAYEPALERVVALDL